MRKVAGILSYVGAPFEGFQRQPNRYTVQGQVEEALSKIVGSPIEIKAAGRTDAGVSALGQVVSFELKKERSLEQLLMQVNRILPKEVAFARMLYVPMEFDPRHSAKEKEYLYRFYFGNKDPFRKDLYARLWDERFDFAKFNEVLQGFCGIHDFACYTSKKEDKDDFIREIKEIRFSYDEDKKEGEILFRANGFMTYMIRYMVGMAFAVAYGKKTVSDALSLLGLRPRKIVSIKAPAEGLCLRRVVYEDELGL